MTENISMNDVDDLRAELEQVRAERDAALARAEKAEAQRDVYTGLYLFANQQHEQQEIELQRYKKIMPCGHARMLEILNDGQMPECSVCWLERVEAERDALAARVAELQAQVKECAEVLAYCYPNEPHIIGMVIGPTRNAINKFSAERSLKRCAPPYPRPRQRAR